jgi:hypothetical protein
LPSPTRIWRRCAGSSAVFLIVEDPDGEEMYFRFYDPRVLRKFLPVCSTLRVAPALRSIETYGVRARAMRIACYLSECVTLRPTALYRPGKKHHFQVRTAHMEASRRPEADDALFEDRLVDYLREEHGDAHTVQLCTDEITTGHTQEMAHPTALAPRALYVLTGNRT